MFILDAKGSVLSGITNGGSKTRYFYKKAEDVVESMKKALAKTSLDQGRGNFLNTAHFSLLCYCIIRFSLKNGFGSSKS